MLKDKDRIFTNLYGFEPCSLKSAKARGDWSNTKDIILKGRDGIIGELTNRLKGKGGAGFPTAINGRLCQKTTVSLIILLINADESEPGTCKDRDILE